ncbi:phytanoyl-CoA dioxygenase family protein [Nitrincola sp. MINF-07-Sa-05]|uniref:phytanoyl-CoA dioxygenase family protein n=1 Tax=Nitrincola salilacus TaxID=3400273 RepID=UPI0039180475
MSPLVSPEDRRQFIRNGFLLKHDFLPAEEFEKLRSEMEDFEGPIREFVEGTTLTQRAFMTQDKRELSPQLKAFTEKPELDRLVRWCSSKNRPPLFYIENLCNHANVSPRPDPQRDLHADTFHPCVKGWLFIDAVDDQNGPHVYVPQSHRLSWKRLRWEYRQSLEASKVGAQRQKGRYWDGSFRVTEQELSEMDLKAVSFKVPANTLLIGNVYGFHCRGEARSPSHRMTIWMQARDNPFNPLFTPFPRATARVFEKVWSRVLERQDRPKIEAGTLRSFVGKFDRTHQVARVERETSVTEAN